MLRLPSNHTSMMMSPQLGWPGAVLGEVDQSLAGSAALVDAGIPDNIVLSVDAGPGGEGDREGVLDTVSVEIEAAGSGRGDHALGADAGTNWRVGVGPDDNALAAVYTGLAVGPGIDGDFAVVGVTRAVLGKIDGNLPGSAAVVSNKAPLESRRKRCTPE